MLKNFIHYNNKDIFLQNIADGALNWRENNPIEGTEQNKGVEQYKEEKISNCIERKIAKLWDFVAMCEQRLLLTYMHV
jgi:hypothetical protein